MLGGSQGEHFRLSLLGKDCASLLLYAHGAPPGIAAQLIQSGIPQRIPLGGIGGQMALPMPLHAQVRMLGQSCCP
jgi:hypothetical protein